MKKIMMILMVAALALPTMAQTFGNQEQPNVQFQSTSTLQGSGSTYSATPALNADGTAYNPAAQAPARSGGSPNKIGALPTENPSTSGSDNTPIGDAVLPLMLMVMAYAVYSAVRVYRRRRRV